MSKNAFLALALEEVGLVAGETPVETVPEEYTDATVDDILEEAEAEQEEVAEKVAEIDTASEVQEGLEALVASMESALADPNYSPREYQLQVSHAAVLLGRIGLGLPAGLSCESTDGAGEAKEGLADKAKKIGKAVADSLKKFFAWLVETGKKFAERFKAGLQKIAARAKTGWNSDADVEFESEVWPGYTFDPKSPLDQLWDFDRWYLDVLGIFKTYAKDVLSKASPEELADSGCEDLIEKLGAHSYNGAGKLKYGSNKNECFYHVAKAEKQTFKFKAGPTYNWDSQLSHVNSSEKEIAKYYDHTLQCFGQVHNGCREFARIFHETNIGLVNFRRDLANMILRHCWLLTQAATGGKSE